MAITQLRLTNLPVAAMGVAVVGLGAAALSFGNGDAVVERGFERALATRAEHPDRQKTTSSAVAGSEQFWLSHAVHDGAAVASKQVSVGDHITINSSGEERILDVVAVQKLDSSLALASTERSTPLLLVTCRDRANPAGRPVRFLIEADGELPALSSTTKTARTL
jgi:hypothetical protein